MKIGNRVLSSNTYGTGENKNQLSQTVFANGQKICYTYNANGDVAGVRYDNDTTDRFTYTYAADGSLQSVTDNATGNVTAYTAAGATQTASDSTVLFSSTEGANGAFTETVFGAVGDYESGESYNSTTGVTAQTKSFEHATVNIDPDTQEEDSLTTGVNFTQTTDWFNRTTSKSAEFSTVTVGDENELFSGSMEVERTYTYADTANNASDRITTITDAVTADQTTTSTETHYEYDAVGNITGICHYEDNVKVYDVRYAYDEANQVTREDNRAGDWTILYQYDAGGNIVSKIKYAFTLGSVENLTPTETNTYTYGDSVWGDLLTAYNGQPITYDAMGNITDIDGETFTWTAGRQLSTHTSADGAVTSYAYNADGQISRMHAEKANGEPEETVEYVWDGDRLAATRRTDYKSDGDGGYIPNDVVATRYLYDADGEPMGFTVMDMFTFVYKKNIFGDITGIDYVDGTPLVDFFYDAYGFFTAAAHMPADQNSQLRFFVLAMFAVTYNVLNYRGYAYAGGFEYLGSRFYSPLLGRFLNADCMYDTKTGVISTNKFAYCNNNPINNIDSLGMTPMKLKYVVNTAKRKVTIAYYVKKIASISIPIYSTYYSHADFSCNDLTYSYGTDGASLRTKIFGSPDGYISINDSTAWKNNMGKTYNSIEEFSLYFSVSEYMSLSCFLTYHTSTLLDENMNSFRAKTKPNSYRVLYGKYKTYKISSITCATFVADMLSSSLSRLTDKQKKDLKKITLPKKLRDIVEQIANQRS